MSFFDRFKAYTRPATDALPGLFEFMWPNDKSDTISHDASNGHFFRFHRGHHCQGKFRISASKFVQSRLNLGTENARFSNLLETSFWLLHLRDFLAAAGSFFLGGFLGWILGAVILLCKGIVIGRALHSWWKEPLKEEPKPLLGEDAYNCTHRLAKFRIGYKDMDLPPEYRRQILLKEMAGDPILKHHAEIDPDMAPKLLNGEEDQDLFYLQSTGMVFNRTNGGKIYQMNGCLSGAMYGILCSQDRAAGRTPPSYTEFLARFNS